VSVRTTKTPVWLWLLQGVLALVFLFSGGSKFVMSAEQMSPPGAVALPVWFLRFIGGAEVLGGLGLLLPAATGIRPELTKIAALALLPIMIGAVVTTLMGEPKTLVVLPFAVLCLVACVAYARRAYDARA
jgi:hypothetical protein